MSKLNIFKPEWIDLVFEGRNKEYGAYQLRSENPKTTVKALILGIVLFSLAVASPKISEWIGSKVAKREKDTEKIIEVTELEEPPVEIPPPPPPPVVEQVQAPKSIVEEVKFKELVVAKDKEVVDTPPDTKQFEEADPSSRNAEKSPTGDINIDRPSGDLDKGVEPDDNTIYAGAGLQVQPQFPGGIDVLRSYVGNNFQTPDVEKDMSVRIIVSFVVEKDGSMTDIKVLKDPGYGLGKEAIRVLKSMKKKWEPGIQNGKPVRSTFTLPISLNLRSS